MVSSAFAAAMPGQTTTAAAAGYGSGNGGGSGGGSTCYPYTYFYTSSGWTEYPTTICSTKSIPYTSVYTTYKTVEAYGMFTSCSASSELPLMAHSSIFLCNDVRHQPFLQRKIILTPYTAFTRMSQPSPCRRFARLLLGTS
jgi:hypothetical protein